MIEIGVNQIYKNFGFKHVLNGLSFEVMTGERVGLVGRNGTGKSTIFKIIAGEETADKGSISIRRGASVGYLEQIPSLMAKHATTKDLLMEAFAEVLHTEKQMQALEQEMARQSNSDALETLLEEYARLQSRFLAMDGYSVSARFNRVVQGFGLTALLNRPFNVLSGGQKTIVKLARTILDAPDILLLDEPTNHLDISTLEWFEDYLSSYKGTVLLISHDRRFLDRVLTKTVIFEGGTGTAFAGNYSFSLQEQERLLLLEFEAFKTQQKKIDAMKAAIKRFREWGARGDNEKFFKKAKELEHRLEKMTVLEKPQLEKPKIPLHFAGDHLGKDVLRLENLHIALGKNLLFSNVNLTLYQREKACLMGDNGTGKTTLLKAVLGELTGYGGRVTLAPSAKIGYIPQEIRFPREKDTVLQAFCREYPCPEEEARRRLSRYFFYGQQVFKRVSALSGGEKVLLKLAILILQNVNLLVLDEPTNHIDIETREMLEEALLGFPSSIFFISHDRYFIQKIANRIFTIQNKDIESFYGDYETYIRLKGGDHSS